MAGAAFLQLTLLGGGDPVYIHVGAVKYFCQSCSSDGEKHTLVSFGHDRILVKESIEEIKSKLA